MTAHAKAIGLDAWIPRLLALWRKQIRRQSGPSDRLLPAEAESVAAAVRRLSQGLTRERELAGEPYFSDPALLGAYLLYFWPLSYLQARSILATFEQVPGSVLDLGSGAGPLAAAALDRGARRVILADRAWPALRLGSELLRLAGQSCQTLMWNPLTGRWPELPASDLIGLEHVLNELWPEAPDRLQRRLQMLEAATAGLRPGGRLLLIEPALTQTSRELLALRNRMLEQGWHVWAPCLYPGPCPVVAGSPGQETCHSEFSQPLPPLLAEIVRRADFQKKSLKATYMLLSRSTPAAARGLTFLAVSDFLISKNKKARLFGCGPAGRQSISLKPADQSPSNRDFLSLRRGDCFRLTGARPAEHGWDLTPESRVTLVRRANDA